MPIAHTDTSNVIVSRPYTHGPQAVTAVAGRPMASNVRMASNIRVTSQRVMYVY